MNRAVALGGPVMRSVRRQGESSMFWPFKKKQPPDKPDQFPPVPKWRPEIIQPLDQIIDRVAYYTNRKKDFAVFRYGTCVLLPDGLSQEKAVEIAKDVLSLIFNYHPDMKPRDMDDGNIAIQYNHPALNVVLSSVASKHWAEIERMHLDALATHEVLMTPLGPNKFDDFGKKALFGRCFMFMDAQAPEVVQIVRAAAA
jgi:hypothetical protein